MRRPAAAYAIFALLGVVLLAAGCTVPGPTDTPSKEAGKAESSASPENQAKAQALAQEGTKVMNDAKLKPNEKYPAALDKYREALALDPNNKEAKENKALIESIYKSMGRPVPGEA